MVHKRSRHRAMEHVRPHRDHDVQRLVSGDVRTSGWRGLIARDFTFDGVRLATQGIDTLVDLQRQLLGADINGLKM